MIVDLLVLLIGYLLFGLVLTLLARRGPAKDWDETLLASVVAPAFFIFIAALMLGRLVWLRLAEPGRANA